MILRVKQAVRDFGRLALRMAGGAAALAPMSTAGAATLTTIFSFGVDNTFFPASGLVIDPAGVLYGTTDGLDLGISTAYRLTPPPATGGQYMFGLLHEFPSGAASLMTAGLLQGAGGAFFGDAPRGGTFNKGLVYSLTPGADPARQYAEKTLFNFTDGRDGGRPSADLISDSEGALYGTTSEGGTTGCANTLGRKGCGVVFKLIPPATKGGAWTEKVLYRFRGGADGNAPLCALMFDSAGVL
jgi:hypothetical protein